MLILISFFVLTILTVFTKKMASQQKKSTQIKNEATASSTFANAEYFEFCVLLTVKTY